MRKVIAGVFFFFAIICAYAQKDVTQFLGIPVDGSKSDMIQKLKAKGFRSIPFDKDVLEGEFNGMDVHLFIKTNSDKVCRIMLADANHVDERSIQIRFNNLCHQFENNPKYISSDNEFIPDEEDISYEISVNNKRYEAAFYQKPAELSDTTLFHERLIPIFLEKYTAEEIANPTEETKNALRQMTIDYMMDLAFKKPVWFIISESNGKYYICMFYDNEYNRANGEDL